ncbi:hypothetical protein KY290_001801 [Solanum tuberosum]|uniref:Uncharacterized protein n=1 Tax=Solanum tuberosum TaxID=4113 RepID=A0ABQ7WQ69_SOLTU|nr:hypothetical protein KY290_001801 [Solanum tuberosum]
MVDAVVTVFLEKLLNVLNEESRFLSQHRQQFEKLKNELLLQSKAFSMMQRGLRGNTPLLKRSWPV